MKRLLLLRHAKSAWDDPRLPDFDRPLSARGERAADFMGAWLGSGGFAPDRVLCSSAARTRATFARILPYLAGDMDVRFLHAIYEAGPEEILAAVRRHGADAPTLMVIGHNPGLQELALALLPDDGGDDQLKVAAHYPTGGLAEVAFDLSDWGALEPHAGRLVRFVNPRELMAAGGVLLPEDASGTE